MGIAKMDKKIKAETVGKPSEPSSTFNVNLKKFKLPKNLDIDDKFDFNVRGKITRISKDEWGHVMSGEIEEIA